MSGHRSRGPWRYHGRRWCARQVIDRYRVLDTATALDFSRHDREVSFKTHHVRPAVRFDGVPERAGGGDGRPGREDGEGGMGVEISTDCPSVIAGQSECDFRRFRGAPV